MAKCAREKNIENGDPDRAATDDRLVPRGMRGILQPDVPTVEGEAFAVMELNKLCQNILPVTVPKFMPA